MSILSGRRVVLGVTGGIAAYKAAELVRLLGKEGAEVRVIMTAAARRFVGEITFQALSGHPVATDLFDLPQESRIGHIRLADEAELLIVAPATADAIAKMAAGLADDLLSTVHLATRAPVLLAPAMNVNMWQHPITQGNLARLLALPRYRTVGPASGDLACGWRGEGRLIEPEAIVQAAEACLAPQDLAGRSVLVTAGGTREPADAVRHLGNRSSGRMGFAVARAARARGARVTLVAAPSALAPPWDVEVVPAATAAEMRDAVRARAAAADVVVMAAAVADYRPADPAAGKLRKQDLGDRWQLRLERTEDILAELGRERRGRRPLLVGFAAEWGLSDEALARKRQAKGCDLLVANDVSAPDAGFEVADNRVRLVSAAGAEDLPAGPKLEVAHRVCERVAAALPGTE